jgi:hypothetical protein
VAGNVLPRLRDRRNPSFRVEIQKAGVVPGEQSIDFDGYALVAGTVWELRGRLTRRRADGVVVVSGVSLTAALPTDVAVTSRVLQAVPLALISERVFAKLKEEHELNVWASALGLEAALPSTDEQERVRKGVEFAGEQLAPPRGRGLKTPPSFYERLAVEAVEIAGVGLPVIAGLADRRSRPQSTIKRWVRDARRIGALERDEGIWKLGPEHPARRETP